MCGGTGDSLRAAVCSPGLSPRVRGNRGFAARGRMFPRTIPACAGEPAYSIANVVFDGDYPRVCGGTSLSANFNNSRMDYPRVCGGTLP